MENNYTLYMHKNKMNGKMYIGITRQSPEKRWGNGVNYKFNWHFYKSIQKYGWDGFDHIILESNLTREVAEAKEMYYIALHDTTNVNNGYNVSNGGNTCGTTSEETRRKLSESKMGKSNPMYGKPIAEERREILIERMTGNQYSKGVKLSPERCIQIGLINKGKKFSKEHCRKISEAQIGRKLTPEQIEKIVKAKTGVKRPPFTDDHKRKISESNKGKLLLSNRGINNKFSKKVHQIDMGTNEIIKTWDCMMDVQRQLGFNSKCISRCCAGGSKSSYKYYWEYAI